MSRKIKYAILPALAVFAGLLIGFGNSKENRLTTKISKAEALIGEKLLLSIRIACPKDTEIEFPGLPPKIKELMIQETFKAEKVFLNRKFINHAFSLISFTPGEYEIPALKLRLNDKEFSTDKIPIKIQSLIARDDKLEIKDIKEPLSAQNHILPLLGICFLILIFGGFLIRKYLKTKKDTAISKPAVPAHTIALEKLRKLRDKDLISRGLIKEFYSAISLIIRRYLEGRFQLRAPEMTTEEFLHHLKVSDALSGSHKQLLKDFLNQCDQVKFAKYLPPSDENEKSFYFARQLIEQTKPAEAAPKKN